MRTPSARGCDSEATRLWEDLFDGYKPKPWRSVGPVPEKTGVEGGLDWDAFLSPSAAAPGGCLLSREASGMTWNATTRQIEAGPASRVRAVALPRALERGGRLDPCHSAGAEGFAAWVRCSGSSQNTGA